MVLDAAFFRAGPRVSGLEVALGAHVLEESTGRPAGDAAVDDVAFVREAAEAGLSLAEVSRLAQIDPQSLSDADRVDLVRAWERVRAMADGHQQVALASVYDATRACGYEGEAARDEVGAALRLSASTAASRVGVAHVLVHGLPATLAALRAGEIGYLHARHLADTLGPLTAEVAAAVEARVLPQAPEQSMAEFRRAVQRAVLAADPAGAAQRADAATAKRSISRYSQPDAVEGWWITLPAHVAGVAWDALTDQAKAAQQEIRDQHGIDPGLDALRVDTLVADILAQQEDGIGGGEPGSPGEDGSTGEAGDAGESATSDKGAASAATAASAASEGYAPLPRCRCGGAQTVAVVIDLPTLLGLADDPGEVPGHGPVPASVARELAADRDWERWTIHPHTRALLDRSPLTYRPGRRLRGFVAAAHRTCGFPGCARPAENSDLDHRVTFRRGGKTIVVNLGPLCRTHHNAQTHGGWRITYNPDPGTGSGVWTWTSPLGKTYRVVHDPPLRA